MAEVTIAEASRAHLGEITAIYAAAARTPATFDLEGKPRSDWERALAATDPNAGDLLLVALEGERVVGFAKSAPHKERPGYATTRETSVYIAEDRRARGIGGLLYGALLERLDGIGLRLAVAGVTQPNPASDRLHLAHGFTEVGVFRDVGVKLGRAWDVRWYQRPLRP